MTGPQSTRTACYISGATNELAQRGWLAGAG